MKRGKEKKIGKQPKQKIAKKQIPRHHLGKKRRRHSTNTKLDKFKGAKGYRHRQALSTSYLPA
jgi:hypothetical protein